MNKLKYGDGFTDYLKNVFTPNDRYTNKANNMLKKYGNYNIRDILIEKSPIVSAIDTALNLISLNKWATAKKKYNYDDLYHLYMIATLDLGEGKIKKILLEKNQSINISDSLPSKTNKTKNLNIFVPKNITLNSLLENTLNKVGYDQYFIYDPFGGRNCQNWIKDVLRSNNLYNDRINTFVFQPIQELKEDLGTFTTTFSKGLTDVAAFGERLLGLGKETEKAIILSEKSQGGNNKKVFIDYLKDKNINPKLYLKIIKYNAYINGYDPKKISFSSDGKHKFIYNSPDGIKSFGAANYNDFIIHFLKNGSEYANKKRDSYHKRFNKTTYGKYSPYELSKNILW